MATSMLPYRIAAMWLCISAASRSYWPSVGWYTDPSVQSSG
jgi:hypothetical protein